MVDDKVYFDLLDRLKEINSIFIREHEYKFYNHAFNYIRNNFSMLLVLEYFYFCEKTEQKIFNILDESISYRLFENCFTHGILNREEGYSMIDNKRKDMLHKVARLSHIID